MNTKKRNRNCSGGLAQGVQPQSSPSASPSSLALAQSVESKGFVDKAVLPGLLVGWMGLLALWALLSGGLLAGLAAVGPAAWLVRCIVLQSKE